MPRRFLAALFSCVLGCKAQNAGAELKFGHLTDGLTYAGRLILATPDQAISTCGDFAVEGAGAIRALAARADIPSFGAWQSVPTTAASPSPDPAAAGPQWADHASWSRAADPAAPQSPAPGASDAPAGGGGGGGGGS